MRVEFVFCSSAFFHLVFFVLAQGRVAGPSGPPDLHPELRLQARTQPVGILPHRQVGLHSFSQCCGCALVSVRIQNRIHILIWLRIRIRIQEAKPMRIQTDPDPDPDKTFGSQKSWIFTWKIYRYFKKVGKRSKNIPTKVQKPFWKAKTRFICKFWSISIILDLDPNPHSQYGSGSKIGSQMNADLGGSISGSTILVSGNRTVLNK